MIIHIGMPKTGTTFLQRGFVSKRQHLLDHKLLYLTTNAGLPVSPPAHHHFLAQGIMGSRKRNTPKADFSLLDAHVEALKEEMRMHPDATPILSSEAFFSFEEMHIAKLRALFPDRDVKIFVYLRRQDAWVDSFFAQMAKGARDRTPEGVYKSHKWHLDYKSYLDQWARHFGADNIIARPYERFSSGTTCMWSDFFAAIGVATAAQITPPEAPANVGLSRELTLFLKNQHVYGNRPELRRLFFRLDAFFPKQKGLKYVDQNLALRILEDVREGNNAVARRYLNRKKLFEDESILGGRERPELSPDHVAQIVGGVTLEFMGRLDKLTERTKALENTAKKGSAKKSWGVRRMIEMIKPRGSKKRVRRKP